MKSLLILVLSLVSQMSFAGPGLHFSHYDGAVVGTVKFTKKWTAVCKHIGCPASHPYTEVTLEKARIEGYGEIPSVLLFSDKKTLYIPYDNSMRIFGVVLRPGTKVKALGTTLVSSYYHLGTTLPPQATMKVVKSVKIVR